MASRVLVALRVAATPERAFEAFTGEIDRWWRPNNLFRVTPGQPGRLVFEPGLGGRLFEEQSKGVAFEIGRITVWDPPFRLAFGWRQASFSAEQTTEVQVSFEPKGKETRITVEHLGWDAIPPGHAARHGFPMDAFQRRLAEWWQALLTSLGAHIGEA